MLSRPPIQTTISGLSSILKLFPFVQDSYKEQHLNDLGFKDIYSKLIQNNRCNGETNYSMKEGLLYKGNTLCVLQGQRVKHIREAYTYQIFGHFGVSKNMKNLQRYVY